MPGSRFCRLSMLLLLCGPGLAHAQAERIRLDSTEARASLDLLDALATGSEPPDALWERLHTSEGYQRLQAREAAMGRAFTDDEFEAFLRRDTVVAGRQRLGATLDAWLAADFQTPLGAALAWLPDGVSFGATVYPLIKPRGNSFVFELDSPNPAIMLFLDPGVSGAQFANTAAHELHHVGYSVACGAVPTHPDPRVREARRWLGAFGEGMAMLAAAGGPGRHPHASSPPEDRDRWDRDVARLAEELAAVQGFVIGVLDGRLVGDEVVSTARGFFGIQGPWYTVGWKMADVVASVRGRQGFVRVMCDPAAFLAAYQEDRVAWEARTGEVLPAWDPQVLDRLRLPASP